MTCPDCLRTKQQIEALERATEAQVRAIREATEDARIAALGAQYPQALGERNRQTPRAELDQLMELAAKVKPTLHEIMQLLARREDDWNMVLLPLIICLVCWIGITALVHDYASEWMVELNNGYGLTHQEGDRLAGYSAIFFVVGLAVWSALIFLRRSRIRSRIDQRLHLLLNQIKEMDPEDRLKVEAGRVEDLPREVRMFLRG